MAVFAGNDFKKWRESQGVSAADLAELISCDTTTIYRYENGKLKPNPDIAYQICEALGDVTKWCDWMRTEYPISYGRVHPEVTSISLPGALLSFFSELQDMKNIQLELMRDGADGKIDDPKLLAKAKLDVSELLSNTQNLYNLLNQIDRRE